LITETSEHPPLLQRARVKLTELNTLMGRIIKSIAGPNSKFPPVLGAYIFKKEQRTLRKL
jgi:hypothetical protein